MKTMGRKETYVVVSITCDRCQATHDDQLQLQEFLSWSDTCGYGNMTYGDLNQIAIDLCQVCVKEVLGPWLRVTKGLSQEKLLEALDD